MVANYLIIFFGSLLGMFLTILAQSEIINRSQKFESGFNQAFKFYTTQQRGGIYVGALMVIIFMFVFPNIMASDNKQLVAMVANLRLWSVVGGVGCQALGFLVVKGTHQRLKDIETKILTDKEKEDKTLN